MIKTGRRLSPAHSGLLVIDFQERLLPAMSEPQRVAQNAARLIQGAALLNLPIWVTEQYRKGLGPTVPEIASLINGFSPFQKLDFSACGAAGWLDALRARQVTDVLLCGIEAHVCVSQTALDLLDEGFRVFVAADAISSRTPENHRIGTERMRDAGAVIVSTEMALLEWLQRAGTEQFKKLLPLIK